MYKNMWAIHYKHILHILYIILIQTRFQKSWDTVQIVNKNRMQ